jgi:hypothetical protein
VVRAGALTARASGSMDARRCTWLRATVTWRWRRSCSRRARPSARQSRCATRGAEGLFHDNDVREGLRCFGFCFSFSDGESAGWFRALTARASGRTDTRRCTTLRSAVTWRWRRCCSRRARPSARQPRCATRGAEGLFHDNDVREGLRCFGFCFSFSDGESAGWFLRVARGGGRGGGCWMGCDGGREGGWAYMLTRACARGRTA